MMGLKKATRVDKHIKDTVMSFEGEEFGWLNITGIFVLMYILYSYSYLDQ